MSEPNATVQRRQMLFVTIILYFSSAVSQPNCLNSERFANNSTYQANLNTLISSISFNIGSSGFFNTSIGQSPNEIHTIVLCRGDISLKACRECINATAPVLVQRCSNYKDAIFWNETCMVRYSSRPIYGRLQIQPVSPNPSTTRVENPRLHDRQLRALLQNLTRVAANGGSFKKVAAGYYDSHMIYALEQCTPDLSVQDCVDCLNDAIDIIPSCCSGIIGAGILRPSCTLRFENYRFYNGSSVVEISQPPVQRGKDSTPIRVIVGVSVAAALVIVVFVAILLVRRRTKRKPNKDLDNKCDEHIRTVETLQHDFGKVRAATDDFSDVNKLGEGGFGAVYRGRLSDDRELAVKRLSANSEQGDLEFKNEIMLVARLQHKNLVRLLGFATEGIERLLIYEYVQDGSLDQFIFDPIRRSVLDWNRRYKIIAGIAKGLLYLHEDSRLKIIHRDLKASNILLDGEMNPKIADFGMAKLFGQDETQRNTNRIVGTYGYMSPEYAMHGQFSVKSDVFSFGVLILEIVNGRKNSSIGTGEDTEDLLSFIWKNWRDGTTANVIDPVLRASDSIRSISRCIHIGLLCVQENPVDRPTMPSIILMLNSSTITLPVPYEPAFFMASRYGLEYISRSGEYDSRESNSNKASKIKTTVSEYSSQNEMSITEFDPR